MNIATVTQGSLGWRVAPDTTTWNSVLNACDRSEKWQFAVEVLRNERCAADVIGCTAAISACGKGGQWKLTLDLLLEMSKARLKPDDACAFAACFSAHLCVLQALPERFECRGFKRVCGGQYVVVAGVVPLSALGFNAAIDACASAGRRQQAWDLLLLAESGELSRSISSLPWALARLLKCRSKDWHHASLCFPVPARLQIADPLLVQACFIQTVRNLVAEPPEYVPSSSCRCRMKRLSACSRWPLGRLDTSFVYLGLGLLTSGSPRSFAGSLVPARHPAPL